VSIEDTSFFDDYLFLGFFGGFLELIYFFFLGVVELIVTILLYSTL
jgi:hypothetical protein